MSLFLNKNNNKFISYFKDDIYIDKSKLIEVTNNNIGVDRKQFMCVTRPRRFGKSYGNINVKCVLLKRL